jgi:hypothetical protein
MAWIRAVLPVELIELQRLLVGRHEPVAARTPP